MARPLRRWWTLAAAGLALVVSLAGTGTAEAAAPALAPGGASSADLPYVHGLLSTPEGGQIEDRYGRTVILHGVNAVYKRAPYELYVDPGKPWNFTARDARTIADLGFNVVRLGIIWAGIEPGTVGSNDPAICTKGTPGDPGQWNEAVAQAYLAKVAQTVDLLGRYHVYSLLDMHEDVYSSGFHGEGAPSWAVCTDGLPVTALPGRWSNTYASPALDAAVRNFWTNDVVGDLQGEFDRSWVAVATVFADNPWVVGYDPINEPFTTTLLDQGPEALDAHLECFYTGAASPGRVPGTGAALSCPPDDPAVGLIPAIQPSTPTT